MHRPASPTRDDVFRTVLAPLTLLLLCPPLVLILWTIVVQLDGSITRAFTADGLAVLRRGLPGPSLGALGQVATFAGVQLLLLLYLPGPTRKGAITPEGNQPSYRLNGVLAFFVTHGLFWVCVAANLFPATVVYDHFGSLLATLCLVALVACVVLYWKGRLFPSSSDRVLTGNPIFDYFQGVELHPRLFGVDLKQLCNCRVAMMGWGVLVVSFAAKQRELSGHLSPGMAVAVALQLAYILKFFVWEAGYFSSLDIMHDRFGFYICWGVLCWLPCVYTLGTLYLVTHPTALSAGAAIAVLLLGLGALLVNYAADRQRQKIRTEGPHVRIWGREPTVIVAPYRTAEGQTRTNLLLASGYWGIARHFHYVPEILLAVAWTIPAGATHALPYFYCAFLTILLFDRAGRDDRRCAAKYGPAWVEYCQRVPYKIIPGVY